MNINKSLKLNEVCYDIRGPILDKVQELEKSGNLITKLNIGDPAQWGFEPPDEIVKDIVSNLPLAQGYSDSQGLFSARKAIMQHYQQSGMQNLKIEDIFLGNGVSELIVMAVQALLNDSDEVLIPSPDYPLWTAAVNLSGGKSIHYFCDESMNWLPDIDDLRSKITSRTKAIVIINPNNPTGAVYPPSSLKQIIEVARENKLVIFSDEIYDKILFDATEHTPAALLANDIVIVTFNGLSKAYRIPGYRSGWMVISGAKSSARDYIDGLKILAAMRLSSNVPGQLAIQTSLGGHQSIIELTSANGRLTLQRDHFYKGITNIPGISCVKPKGAFYLFPKLEPKQFSIFNDEKLIMDLLINQKILLVQGTAFNCNDTNHFRIVFLPHVDQIRTVIPKIDKFFKNYKQNR